MAAGRAQQHTRRAGSCIPSNRYSSQVAGSYAQQRGEDEAAKLEREHVDNGTTANEGDMSAYFLVEIGDGEGLKRTG